MDAALEQLLPQVREAVRQDGSAVQQVDTSLAQLLKRVRDALHRDEVAAGEDDKRIADHVTQLIPSLRARLKQAHTEKRGLLARDRPWTLEPLDSALDLLGPLGKARNEVVHTQALAYLLDHRAAHGLDVRCLRELLALLGRRVPGDDVFERLSQGTEETNERLRGFAVYPERRVDSPGATGSSSGERRCDIWLELTEEERSIVVIIENKVDAGEHSSQLSAYEGALFQWTRQRRRLSFDAKLVLLTPDGRPPDNQADQELWVSVSYRELAAALANAGRDAPQPGRMYLMLYVSTILKHVLGIGAQADEISFVRQLPFMQAVIDQGASHE